jgi:hypothetical protein
MAWPHNRSRSQTPRQICRHLKRPHAPGTPTPPIDPNFVTSPPSLKKSQNSTRRDSRNRRNARQGRLPRANALRLHCVLGNVGGTPTERFFLGPIYVLPFMAGSLQCLPLTGPPVNVLLQVPFFSFILHFVSPISNVLDIFAFFSFHKPALRLFLGQNSPGSIHVYSPLVLLRWMSY